jgi:hypothetical protein
LEDMGFKTKNTSKILNIGNAYLERKFKEKIIGKGYLLIISTEC